MSNMSDQLKRTLGILDDSKDELGIIQDGITGEELGVEEQPPREVRPLEVKTVVSEVPALTGTDAKTDYVFARNMTYTLLDMTGSALQGALQVATETEHPRAYGIFNELATTMRELTKDLIQLQKTFKDVTRERPEMAPPPPAPVAATQVNVNLGTQGGILDILEQARRELELQKQQDKIVGEAKIVGEDDGDASATSG